jgi:hypothetical protein
LYDIESDGIFTVNCEQWKGLIVTYFKIPQNSSEETGKWQATFIIIGDSPNPADILDPTKL